MKNLRAFVLCFFPIVLGLLAAEGCKKEPPVVPEPTLSLTAVDASCTETWLKATITQLPATVRLLRDGQHVSDLRLLTSDSLLIDEGLLPNRAYTYQLQRLASDSSVIETSPATGGMQVTTMDTTSHNFTWQIDTLGVTSSVLYDCAIITENNIWAVGELFLRDSSGQLDPRRYNLAIWDGNSWRIERIMYQGSPPVLRSIFAFAENDVWLDPWFHWNGQTLQQVPIDPIFIGVGVNKMWGSPDGRLYVVGNGGLIAERGSSGMYRRIESGTSTDIQDIWSSSTTDFALAAISNVIEPGDLKILKITSSQKVEPLAWNTGRRVHSLWFNNDKKIFASGGGVFIRYADLRWREQTSVPLIYTRRVRGVSPQDMFVVGDFGLVAHFNGIDWRVFPQVAAALYYSCDYRGNRMIAVGERSGRAVVLQMWR